ncbi:GumC family protein [Mucilaginibacter terrae]|uniref:GumC family protein n=1 Tax=Mucilaginibacter terrae TaxID=1955052 RepID=UPI00363E5DBB
MSTNHNYNNNLKDNQQIDEDVIDLKQIVLKITHNWPLYLLSIILCVFLAVLYAYYTPKSWQVNSKILVKNDNNDAKSALGGSISSDVGSLFSAKSSADNEIQVLRSRTLMKNTVEAMQLNVKVFSVNGFKSIEIYNEAPFTLVLVAKTDSIVTTGYNIEITGNNSFTITDNEDFKETTQFGKIIKFNQYDLIFHLKPNVKWAKKYKISIQSTDAAISNFTQDFLVGLSDKQASTIDLSLNYSHPAKGEAILNKIMQLYLSSNLQNEKQIADSTMAFIDTRIGLVSKELNNIEKKFENYKTENNIANISEQSKALVSSASDYYDKIAQQDVQISIVKDIEQYLKNPLNRNIIPSSLINTADLAFGQSIKDYNDLLVARDKASLSYTDENPVIQNINKQIDNLRLNILQNINIYRNGLQVGKKQIQKQNSGFTGQLSQLPGKERIYLDFSRQQNLKQQLYLFLLQKREETAIFRNSTISNSRIIDTAKSDFFPYKPKRSTMYLIGFIIGIMLPSIYLMISAFLNVRIDGKSDIEKATTAPILGEIGHNSDKQSLVTGTNSRSVISEQFRSLRTNLQFVLDPSKSNVLLFTSSMSGEGKSFLSLNIGSALALTNKKVVFMEMDLRKPKLSESVGLDINNGYTNYAISDNDDYDYSKLLKPLSFNKNCYLISSGPIPPNPAELLINGKMEKLISYLKGEFDYIIFDCPPVGLVTDALMLEKYADIVFYVTREGFTYKSQLNIVNQLLNSNKVKNIYLIVNDIKSQKLGYSSYQQAYGYGIEENVSWLSKFKFWK